MNENLKFWESVEKTDPKHTKPVTFGRKFTAIDAYYQIKTATEQWGPYGIKWGIKNESISLIYKDYLLYQATFFSPGGESSISNGIKIENKKGIDEDCIKKVKTDSLTKELSYRGFNADVFLGKFDDNRYINALKQEYKGNPPTPPPPTQRDYQPKTTAPTPEPSGRGITISDKFKNRMAAKGFNTEEKMLEALHRSDYFVGKNGDKIYNKKTSWENFMGKEDWQQEQTMANFEKLIFLPWAYKQLDEIFPIENPEQKLETWCQERLTSEEFPTFNWGGVKTVKKINFIKGIFKKYVEDERTKMFIAPPENQSYEYSQDAVRDNLPEEEDVLTPEARAAGEAGYPNTEEFFD